MRRRDMFAYVIARVLGAALGAIALRALWGGRRSERPFGAIFLGWEVTVVQGFLAQTGISLSLGCDHPDDSQQRQDQQMDAAGIWVPTVVIVFFESPITGASFSPARSFGPAHVGNQWINHWLNWVAPPFGAALAVSAFRGLGRRQVRCCKLFRPLRSKKCIFKDCAYQSSQGQK